MVHDDRAPNRWRGTASIQQQNPDKDIIAGATAVRIGVHFINFVGGKNQLTIGNTVSPTLTPSRPPLTESIPVAEHDGLIKISDCSFANSNSAAIRIVGPSCPDASCPESHPVKPNALSAEKIV